MKIVNTDETVTIRGVEFAKGKTVNLKDNKPLFDKVSALPCFEAPKRKVKRND